MPSSPVIEKNALPNAFGLICVLALGSYPNGVIDPSS